MAYDDHTRRLQAELDAALRRVSDAQVRDLVEMWAIAWDEIDLDLTAALLDQLVAGQRITRAQLLRSVRLRLALQAIAARLETLAAATSVRLTRDLRQVIDTAGGAQASIIDSQLPPGFMQQAALESWTRVDPRQVAAIVQRATEQITSRTWALAQDAYDGMKRELIRGVAVGSNPKVTARRIIQRTQEAGFTGGLTRALTIARTETVDAHRSAAHLGQAQHADVLAGWVWLASLGPRTCPACFGMHGTVHDLDEPGPQGHQNCRCSRMPKTKSWADLGFDGIEEPPSLLADADEVFAGLTPQEQYDILGKRGYQAWRSGEWPREKWAVRRTTAGWRDSHVVAKPPIVADADLIPLPDTLKPWQFGRGAKALATGPRQALQQIQKLHAVPMLANPVQILPMSKATAGQQGRFVPSDLTIRISPNAIGKGLTTLHEFGHYLDFQDFGGAKQFASRFSTAPDWVAVRAALEASPEVVALRAAALLGDDHAAYLVRDVELFARSYAQWVTLRSGSKALLRDLNRMRRIEGNDSLRQWSDESFDAIAQALDALFASRMTP